MPSRRKPQDEPVELLAQVGEARRHRPRNVALGARRKGDIEVEVDVAGERGCERAHDRVADGAVRNLGDESGDRGQRERLPFDSRMSAARDGDFVVESCIGEERDRRALEVAPFRGLVAVAVVDQHRLRGGDAGRPRYFGGRRARTGRGVARNAPVGIGRGVRRTDGIRRRGRPSRAGRRQRAVEAAGADVRIALGDGGDHLGGGFGQGEPQRQFLLGGEPAREVDVDSGQCTIRARENRRRVPAEPGRRAPSLPPARTTARDCAHAVTERRPLRRQCPPGAGGSGAKVAISIEWRWRQRHDERRNGRL